MREPSPRQLREGISVLTITPAALNAIDELSQDDQDAVGLRIGRSAAGSISLNLAAGPRHDDTVVWSHSTIVFVDRGVAASVENAVLDLRSTPDSSAFFLR